MGFHAESGFVARGADLPRRDNVRDWIAWHFIHRDNLVQLRDTGHLLPSALVTPQRSVADRAVKERRVFSVQPDAEYPPSTVREHVPFYLAAKSPMLFKVTSPGPEEYRAPQRELVFLGCAVGDVMDAGFTWCFSNANASSPLAEFSRDPEHIGDFVDFDLLCRRVWRRTSDDAFRPSRRAAEFLVLGSVPLALISLVVTRHEENLAHARVILGDGIPTRRYSATDALFYS
ncbi:DUF4433 domain-containing protein [Actinoplanes sp. RD1]|uniref:DUF4433 domain-containing protein n=1 Tax=Actinoplanes sp. RD1 TaxID=3064538 RepID=UPI0027403236|nr:DUF4433 domain-containing protein [Actinoplanes sp. RD1]